VSRFQRLSQEIERKREDEVRRRELEVWLRRQRLHCDILLARCEEEMLVKAKFAGSELRARALEFEGVLRGFFGERLLPERAFPRYPAKVLDRLHVMQGLIMKALHPGFVAEDDEDV
jgi:hypothetical protein